MIVYMKRTGIMKPTRASSSGVCQFRKIEAMRRLGSARQLSQTQYSGWQRRYCDIVKCSMKYRTEKNYVPQYSCHNWQAVKFSLTITITITKNAN